MKVNKLLSLIHSHHLDCCMQKTINFQYKMAVLNFDNKNKTSVIKYVKLVSVRIYLTKIPEHATARYQTVKANINSYVLHVEPATTC